MNLKKLAPWNWFKRENESDGRAVPVNMGYSIGNRSVSMTPLHCVFDEIDRLFDTAFNRFGLSPFGENPNLLEGMSGSILKPRLDLGATEKEYTVSVEIPGVNEKDVQLEISNNTLTICGEKKQKTEEKNKSYYRVERSYGSFQRVLSLPEDADQGGVKAIFKKGLLTITIPRKALPGSKVKQVEINYA